METKQSVRVRKSVHGDKPGFLVCGKAPGALFGVSVFVRSRRTADLIAAVYRTRTDRDEVSALVDGFIRNESENLAGWGGWS